ncbi:nuclear transport factor 2 family protein [Streptomyces sp. NBC_00487]|uniref:nuclear transport factor 2 family protein n=1 Tax=unclassified Streptomyces TaxID=2593676 RepID=UPI002E189A5E|nr:MULTISPECIES: nuclear transport factor 2 family protein [unclassified Streptomyces]
MAEFPHFNAPNAVSGADRADAIELVNRVNWLFDIWDVDRIMDLFLPDAVTRHPYGVVSGRTAQRKFLEGYYPLIPGVSRHATNHIVDADGDDLVVRYYNLLVRYAMPDDAETVRVATEMVGNDDGLPAIWITSPMMDRIRRTNEGWKIAERLVGGTVRSDRLTPQQG